MAVWIVRLGTARQRGEGPRLGTVRRPPRGVPKARYAADDWYDVWLPTLAPSAPLMQQFRRAGETGWPAFARRFRTEMKQPEAAHLLDALAVLSHTADFSIGCYCEDAHRCHRSLLRAELTRRGAAVR